MTDQVQNPADNLVDLFAEFAVDKDKAQKGAPLKIGGSTFMVAKANSAEFLAGRIKLFTELNEKYTEEQRKSPEFNAAVEDGLVRLYAKHVLVGWDKIKYNGKVYDGYDEELAYQLLKHEDFAELILVFSSNRRNYGVMTEEVAKN